MSILDPAKLAGTFLKGMIGAAAVAGSYSLDAPLNAEGKMDGAEVRHSTLKVGGVTVFYREAGLEDRPVLLLLHGFANSSHYFRHLMPLLANRFHLIAPDVPSFGFTKVDGEDYRYTFAQLTQTTQGFVDALALQRLRRVRLRLRCAYRIQPCSRRSGPHHRL
jgi:hypothetical protein